MIIVNVIIKECCLILYNNNVIIHIAVLICNLSAAVTPCNYGKIATFYTWSHKNYLKFALSSLMQHLMGAEVYRK